MEFVSSKMCMLKDLGMGNSLFGGYMFCWADETAAIYARKTTSEKFIVTKHFGQIDFNTPVKPGDIIDFYCELTDNTNSSISFDIEAVNHESKKTVFCTNAVFVAVDENGKKKNIENREYLIVKEILTPEDRHFLYSDKFHGPIK
jgi:acyl-CoA hydrolase